LKESLTAIDIMVLVGELKALLKGAIVSNIYHVPDSLFLFKLHTKDGRKDLLIEPPRRIHLTKYEYPKPQKPTSFCYALRRALRQARIQDILQVEMERIVEISLLKGKEGIEYRLVIELFREGNLILIDADGRILQALRYKRMRDRAIVRGEHYVYPPRNTLNPLEAPITDVLSMFSKSKGSLVRNLVTRLGIPPEIAEEICFLTKIPKDRPIRGISPDEVRDLLRSFREIYESLAQGSKEPCIVKRKEGYVGVYPLRLKHLEHMTLIPFKSFNEAVDEYFSFLIKELDSLELRKSTSTELLKLERRIAQHKELMNQRLMESKRYRDLADSLYANLPLIEALIKTLKEFREKLGSWDLALGAIQASHPSLARYISSIEPHKATIIVKVGDKEIPLDLRLSPAQNAERYYNLAKNLARKAKRMAELIEAEKLKLLKIGQESPSVTRLKPRFIQRREWYERFYWFRTSNDVLVIGGRDSRQNDLLVKRYLRDDYLFFHADIYGGPVVVSLADRASIKESDIQEAAQFAASFSRAWREGLSSIDVYWVYGHQVSKSPPSGEYLPRGAFMVRGKRNYLRNVPLKVKVLLLDLNGLPKLMCASALTSRHECLIWIELMPGGIEKRKVSQKIKDILIKKCGVDDFEAYLRRLPVEEIERLLPPGRARIMRIGSHSETQEERSP